jgi:hypothetical protein
MKQLLASPPPSRLVGALVLAGGAALSVTALFATAQAATLYVDATLTSDCVGSYDVSARACGSGSEQAYATLAAAAAASQPGDEVRLREGTFGNPLSPSVSGTATDPITFRSHDGETATLSGISSPALQVINQSHLVIEGLAVDDVLGWGRLEGATHVVIRNNQFTQATATGTTGGLKLVQSDHNRIEDNLFEDGNDNVVVQESDHNLLVNNQFIQGRHSLLSVRCGNYNVFRGNSFHNADQKAAEIYDCEGVSDAPFLLDATKRNFFEGNVFEHTMASTESYRYNGIQYAGQDGVVRRNVFYDNLGGGLHFQVYSDEALVNNGHRAYHNTFHANRCFGLAASSTATSSEYFGSIVKNCLLYENSDCAGQPPQVNIGNPEAVVLDSNAEVDTPPLFVDAQGRDYRLTDQSPMVDAAAFLTETVGAGSGTALPVADAAYFYDGNQIEGEQGDLIQLEGQSETVRIVAVDVAGKLLTVDEPLSWEDQQGVSLAFGGSAPDMGAFELGLAQGGGGTGAGGSSSGTGGTSAGGTGGVPSGSSSGQPEEDSGCGCRQGAGREGPMAWFVAGLLVVMGGVGRRRRSARSQG